MFRRMLAVQWMRTRAMVTLLGLVTFALPLLMVSEKSTPGVGQFELEVGLLLENALFYGRVLPLLALFLGVYLGVAVWADDQRGGHVYALSLPVRRDLYALLRFGAAGLVLLVPAFTLLIGALLASAVVELPSGLNSYPVPLFGRFLLASLTCFALFFAIVVSTRRAVLAVFGVIGGLLLGQFVLSATGSEFNLIEQVLTWLTSRPSPFELLTGRWALFDV